MISKWFPFMEMTGVRGLYCNRALNYNHVRMDIHMGQWHWGIDAKNWQGVLNKTRGVSQYLDYISGRSCNSKDRGGHNIIRVFLACSLVFC